MAQTFWEEDAVKELRTPGRYVVLTREQADRLADYIQPLEKAVDDALAEEESRTELLKAASAFFDLLGKTDEPVEFVIRRERTKEVKK